MSLYRIVDGRRVELTAEQEAQVRAEWQQATEEARVPRLARVSKLRIALINAGMDDGLQQAIAALPGNAGKLARVKWAYDTLIRRDDPLLAQVATALGWTTQQLDDVFIAAN